MTVWSPYQPSGNSEEAFISTYEVATSTADDHNVVGKVGRVIGKRCAGIIGDGNILGQDIDGELSNDRERVGSKVGDGSVVSTSNGGFLEEDDGAKDLFNF